MTRRILCALALLVAAGLAAGRPDMGGTWRLNAQKSDFVGLDAPSSLTLVIKVNGEKFDVTQQSDGGSLELHFSTDDKEMVNDLGNVKMTSRHRWEGEAVTGEYRLDGDGFSARQKDRITYSADGKQMTILRDAETPHGKVTQKMVFDKE